LRSGDRLAVDDDVATRLRVPPDGAAPVLLALPQGVGLHVLEPVVTEHEGEHEEPTEDRDPAQGLVHGRTTWVISASGLVAGGGAGRRAVSLMRSRMPISAQLAMTEEPP